MNGIDYSKSLARERDSYLKNLQDKDRAVKEEIKNMEDAHEHVQKSQKEAFTKDKSRMENQFQDRVETISNDQREALVDKSKKYNEAIQEEKKRFTQESQGVQKGFSSRLDELQKDYSQKFADQEKNNTAKTENDRKAYDQRLKLVENDHQSKVKKFQDTAVGDNRSLADSFAADKKELVNKQEQDKIKLMKEETVKRNLMRDQVVKDLDKIKGQQEEERIANWAMQKERFDQVQKDANLRIGQTQEKSNVAQERMVEEQKKEIQDQNKFFNKRYSDQEKFFNDNQRQMEMKDKRSVNTAGSLSHKLAAEDQFLKDEATRNKINNVIQDRQNLQSTFNQTYDSAIDKFQDEHKNQSVLAANNLEKKEQVLLQKNFEDSIQNRMGREEITRQFSQNLKNERDVNFSQRNHLEESGKSQVNHLKENFHKTLSDLAEKNNANFAIMKQSAAEEQKKIMEEISKQNSNDKADLKKQFISKIEVLNGIFDKKVTSLEQANQELRGRFEDTVTQLAYQNKKELDRINTGHEKNLAFALDTERKIGEGKVNELKDRITRMENTFSNKMIQEKRLSEKQLRDYQIRSNEQMDMIKKKYDDMLAEQSRNAERDKTRLVEEQNFKLKAVVTQYESQIQNYKDREAANIAAMRDFKSAMSGEGSEKA